MADCATLLDEELSSLSSLVFSYLTASPGRQYGEEISTDRLDMDFPDIDLSQLDTCDFDSVNCLSELHWCHDQADSSPTSNLCSSGDAELFEIEEENAALLAALTDSLDGMVEDEVGGLSVFPSLGVGPEEEDEEEEEDLLLDNESSHETEDPSLLKKLLLSPPNMPATSDAQMEGYVRRHSNRSHHLKVLKPLIKCGGTKQSRPRASRPSGHQCTELHRHLTTAQDAEDTPSQGNTEEESESEPEEEEDEVSGSECETSVPLGPAALQFTSEKDLRGMVELIRYMHTYCLPSRKHPAPERRESLPTSRRGRSDCPPAPVFQRPRIPFIRKREARGPSLLQQLLETMLQFDVSKPYRLQNPPYVADYSAPKAVGDQSDGPHTDLLQRKELAHASFTVRRSRRLASFPSRFARKMRPTYVSDCSDTPIAVGGSCKSPRKRDSGCILTEKRPCLCLPLASTSSGNPTYGNKPFEHSLSVELCGTAGLTPPTTPPHKSLEDELFKPEVQGEPLPRGPWLSRAHSRKFPQQTELYAQLCRMGQMCETGPSSPIPGTFGDHDYCMQSCRQSRSALEQGEGEMRKDARQRDEEELQCRTESIQVLSPHNTGNGEEHPSRTSSPNRPASCCQAASSHNVSSCETAVTIPEDEQGENMLDNCQVFYIHNLPLGITEAMLCKRFMSLGEPQECKIIIKNEERCGMIALRQPPADPALQRRVELPQQTDVSSARRLSRKRYIDLDEAGPGPVKSKYDALDFDTLLKEAQRSLHR